MVFEMVGSLICSLLKLEHFLSSESDFYDR